MDINALIQDYKEQLMDSLKMSPKLAIGVDIGSSSVKIVELAESGNTFLLKGYARMPLPEGSMIEDEFQKKDAIVDAINDGLKQIGASHRSLAVSLFGSSTTIKKLQLPGGTEQEIADQVEWEIEQYLPFPIDEATISHHIVGGNIGGGVDLVIGAARETLVERYTELGPAVQGKVKIIDLEGIALVNVVELVYNQQLKENPSTVVVINAGAQKTTLMLFKEGSIVFWKELPVGGLTITEEIQRQMGVSFEEAESLKIYGDGNGNIPEEIALLIDDILSNLFKEFKTSIDFYIASTQDNTFSSCYMTGGGALTVGFAQKAEELLGFQPQQINPFEKIKVTKKHTEEIQSEIATTGLIALSLAMRSLRK